MPGTILSAGPIAVASSVTIRAVAYLSGRTISLVSSGVYTITEPKVKVTVGARDVVFDWTTDHCDDRLDRDLVRVPVTFAVE